uniref:ATP-binding protein n=2 Tax=Roseivirga sp. TaxID=1964215 RepID=UPI004047AE2B
MNELSIIEHLTISDLSEELVQEFHSKLTGRSESDLEKIISDLKTFNFFATKDGSLHPRLVAVLFMHPQPAEIFPQFKIQFGVFEDRLNRERPLNGDTLSSNLPQAFEDLINLVKAGMRKAYVVVDYRRVNIYEYPLPMLREALINALVHRDYGSNERISIDLYVNDSLRIYNPGKLTPGISIEDLKRKDYNAHPRNPKIVQAMSLFVTAEGKGEGVKVIYRAAKNNGLREPSIEETKNGFEVSLFGPGEQFDKNKYEIPRGGFELPKSILSDLNQRPREILKLFLKEPDLILTNKLVQNHFSVVRDTAHKDILELLAKGLIAQHGAGRSTHYKFNPSFAFE